MATEEQVLVVERKVLEQAGMFQGLTLDVQRYLPALFAPGVPRFLPRPAAEKDPSHKQLIPYVIIACEGKVLSYVRGKRAGETRLVGLRSIGIGGHINPDDHTLFSTDFRDAYRVAVEREVAEEISVEAPHSDNIVALLNDDSTEVGQVHLGIVHYWALEAPKVNKREQMITQMSFLTVPELREVRDSMESWSQFCLDCLADIIQQGDATK
jgi:predicted NUDIX family phosphoesterase